MDEVTQVSPPRSEQEIETLHRRLRASSVFTILQIQPTMIFQRFTRRCKV